MGAGFLTKQTEHRMEWRPQVANSGASTRAWHTQCIVVQICSITMIVDLYLWVSMFLQFFITGLIMSVFTNSCLMAAQVCAVTSYNFSSSGPDAVRSLPVSRGKNTCLPARCTVFVDRCVLQSTVLCTGFCLCSLNKQVMLLFHVLKYIAFALLQTSVNKVTRN